MNKVFNFIESLNTSFYEVLGDPTLKILPSIVEVSYKSNYVFTDFDIFKLGGFDEFRFYADCGYIIFIFTFYKCED